MVFKMSPILLIALLQSILNNFLITGSPLNCPIQVFHKTIRLWVIWSTKTPLHIALICEDALWCTKPVKKVYDALGDHLSTLIGYGIDLCPFGVLVDHDTHIHVSIIRWS